MATSRWTWLSSINRAASSSAPVMGTVTAGDDMSYFLQEVPGAYFFVGTRSSEANSTFPHHHPRFTIDERSLAHGAETLVRAALAALARSG